MENRHALPAGIDCVYYLVCRFCNEFKPRSMFAEKTTSGCRHPFDSFAAVSALLERGVSNNDFLVLTPENAICTACLCKHVSTARAATITCPLQRPGSATPCSSQFTAADIQRLLTASEFKT